MYRKMLLFSALVIMLSLAGASSALTDANLVGWWNFNDGTATDLSGYFPDVNEDDANGMLVGNAMIFGGELVMDGTGGVDCNDYVKFDCNDGFTIVFRVQYDNAGLGVFRQLISKDDNTGYRIGVNSTSKPQTYTTFHDPNSAHVGISSLDLNDEAWHHIAYLYDGSVIRIMTDTGQVGAAVDSIPTTGKVVTNGYTFKVGMGNNPGQNFIGKMDDVQIYNYGMSEYGVKRLVGAVNVNVSYDPSPADGAIGQPENAQFSWRAGEGAISHDVYFGTVNPPTLLGNDTPITADPGALAAGNTYYWRIDEVTSGGTVTGSVWSFSVSAVTAKVVDPYDGAQYVPIDANLVWQAGTGATGHNLYFGITNPPPAVDSNMQVVTYDPPADMNNGTVYYWRVDENPGPVIGTVWSFTTNSGSAAAFDDTGISTTGIRGWWKLDEGGGSWAYDSSGNGNTGVLIAGVELNGDAAVFNGTGKIDCGKDTSLDVDNAFTIMAKVKGSYPSGSTHLVGTHNSGYRFNTGAWAPGGPIFNYVVTNNGSAMNGAEVEVWDGDWHHVACVYDGSELRMYYNGIDRTENSALLTGNVLHDSDPFTLGNNPVGQGIIGQMRDARAYDRALTSVEIFAIAGNDPELPVAISPANNSININTKTALEWSAGVGVTSHEVYFGTDFNDVNDGIGTLISIQSGTRYPAIGTLNLTFNTTYYWRINELPTNASGTTWKFTTGGFIGLDGFESYTGGTNLRNTWVPEGYAAPSFIYLSKLSTDGRANSGSQSMRNNYFNSASFGYCGAYIDFGASLQDLTANGLAAMSLYFSGKTTNTITANDELYITLEDNDGNVATVYRDDDVNDSKLTTWQLWAVDIQDFVAVNADLNLAEIKKISIGVGKGGTGSTGDVYFDDVRFEISKCIPALGPLADLTDDCLVTYEDLKLVLEDYLESEGLHASSAPGTGPIGQWNFDNGNANDSGSGAAADGTLWGDAYIDNNELVLDTNTCGVDCGNDVPKLNITGNYTLTAFVKTTHTSNFQSVATKGENGEYRIDLTKNGSRIFSYLKTEVVGPNAVLVSGGPRLDDGEWHHLGVVYDGAALHVYVDGGIAHHNQSPISGTPVTDTDPFEIGNNQAIPSIEGFVGRIDDVELYNYALTAENLKYLASSRVSLVIPLPNPERELTGDGKINLKDIAKLGIEWLDEVLWP